MLKIRRVALGISGGVDSAVTALLLKRKGYDVQGIFMQNWDIADEKGRCTADEDYKDAAEICEILNIKLHHVNFVKEYWNEVFCNLIKEYETGRTPNPDILCNRNIKFNYFYNYAINNIHADAIATGHYARTSFGPYLEYFQRDKAVRLLRAKDVKKDQTFFLCQIEQRALKRTMFPLGDFMKWEVKHMAVENNLTNVASKRESMGICFIGSRNFQNFIREYINDKPGNFVNVDSGEVIGRHNGIHQWTLGQRTKLQGLPDAVFVARKDLENNIIYVAQGSKHPILHTNTLFTETPHWIHSQPEELKANRIFECYFKFQHTEKWVPCEVCETKNGLCIMLKNAKRAITPGQFAVLSKGDEVLGSAKIVNSGISNFSLYYLQNNNIKDVSTILDKYKKYSEINNVTNDEILSENYCEKKESANK